MRQNNPLERHAELVEQLRLLDSALAVLAVREDGDVGKAMGLRNCLEDLALSIVGALAQRRHFHNSGPMLGAANHRGRVVVTVDTTSYVSPKQCGEDVGWFPAYPV